MKYYALIYPALSVVYGWVLSFSYILLLVGSYFLSPFRLLCCIWNYKTIVGGFNPERVPSYPRNGKEVAIIAYNLVTVSAFLLHHHSAIIVRACLFGAWVCVCLIKAVNVATVVCVNITLCLFGCVVDCLHCFVILLFVFSFSLSVI